MDLLDDDGDSGQAWVWHIDEAGELPSGSGAELFDVNPDIEGDGDDEAGYGWLYAYDWSGDGRPDLVSSTLMSVDNSAETALIFFENQGSESFVQTGLGMTWHGFGDNNMFMQDFVGTPSSP